MSDENQMITSIIVIFYPDKDVYKRQVRACFVCAIDGCLPIAFYGDILLLLISEYGFIEPAVLLCQVQKGLAEAKLSGVGRRGRKSPVALSL